MDGCSSRVASPLELSQCLDSKCVDLPRTNHDASNVVSIMRSSSLRRRRTPPISTSTTTLPWISPLTPRNPTPPPPPPPPPSSAAATTRMTHETLILLLSTRNLPPEAALEAFHRASAQPGFTHNHSTFSALLRSLAAARAASHLRTFLELLHLHPCRIHESLLLSLMSLFSRLNLPHLTLRSFHLIPSLLRRPPSPRAHSTCLHLLLLRHSRPDLARSLLLSSRLPLATCIHNILLKYHCCTNNLPKALDILRKMRNSPSSKPNLITYTTLMLALSSEGRLQDAYHLFDEMIDRDNLLPDAVTYNVLIVGFCRAGLPDKAHQVLHFMRRNGCEPNVFNYSAVVDGFCKGGRVDDARKVFDELRKRYAGDVVGYTTMIGGLCRKWRTDEAMELVVEMREKGAKPDAILANLLLEGLCGERRFAEAMAVLGEDDDLLKGVRLNKASYRIVINSLCKQGEIGMAVELLRLMLRRGVVPHHAASNGLLVKLCELGMVAEANDALFRLSEFGFLPEVDTWERLVGGACQEEEKMAGIIQMFVGLGGAR